MQQQAGRARDWTGSDGRSVSSPALPGIRLVIPWSQSGFVGCVSHVPTGLCAVPADASLLLTSSTASPQGPLTRMVVTTSVLFANVCDRLMSRVVAFMARVRLEYHTPIWGGEGCGTPPGPTEDLSPPGPALPSPLLPPPAPRPGQGPGPAHLTVALPGLL